MKENVLAALPILLCKTADGRPADFALQNGFVLIHVAAEA